jgi:hypothetical protein
MVVVARDDVEKRERRRPRAPPSDENKNVTVATGGLLVLIYRA